MNYLIKFPDEGYFSYHAPYRSVKREEASVFTSMKDARKQKNKLEGRLMKGMRFEIEPE
jgi:hypothetical protein